MGVFDQIVEHATRLTPTERRIAEVLANEPQVIAFGTVAQVAERAATSGPSVVRLAAKLGYPGFIGLQAAVQAELATQLGMVQGRSAPARDAAGPVDLRDRVAQVEADNVAVTLSGLPDETLERALELLGDPERSVWVVSGEVTGPVGTSLAAQLACVRPCVTSLAGSPAALGRAIAAISPGDVIVAIDVRRYERALVDAVALAREKGAEVVAVTDGPLSPLATPDAAVLFVAATGVGGFDSMTGALALTNLLAAGVAQRLPDAPLRFEATEEAWAALDALVGQPSERGGQAAGAGASDLVVDLERLARGTEAGHASPYS